MNQPTNILVTGVSRGLGLQIAKQLLANKCTVYGISRTLTDDLKALQKKYTQNLLLLQADLSDLSLIDSSSFKTFLSKEKSIHGFVNNAALAYEDLVSNLQLEPLGNMFNVNVFAPMMLSRYVLRNMILHQTKGSFVHLSSVSAHTGYKGLSMYAASKGAVEAFSKNMAREWGSKGIRSNCVVAGFMSTDMSASLSLEQKQKIYCRTSLKQATSIESVVSTVQFLLFDGQSITGQNIFVDAGTI